MSKLAVRVAEDPSRPLGHAVIIVEGLPKTLETFEFALRRHGYPDNNLGPEGWQGPDCWLTTEEAWYSGESFKFVVGPQGSSTRWRACPTNWSCAARACRKPPG